MEHLSPETLARLVDDPPAAREQGHLERCRRCREELDALREQTEALGVLPAVRPPAGGWESLEARLRAEGLLSEPAGRGGAERREPPPRRGSHWTRVASMAATLVVGMGLGMGFSSIGDAAVGPGTETAATRQGDPLEVLAVDLERALDRMTDEEAEELVRRTEEWYLTSLVRFQERMREAGSQDTPDPIGRFAAIEALMAAGQAAVREAPTDPFLNGLLLNMHAERELAIRGLQARQVGDNWY